MSDSVDAMPTGPSEEPLLDALLREAIPEIKLALGDLIDRDNARALPDRYAKLLPEATLAVTLRPDAAEALLPIAAELEAELSDSCTRHGSLYDRVYRVRLRRADAQGVPLFRVSTVSGREAEVASVAPPPPPVPSPAAERTMAAPAAPPSDPTMAAPPRRAPMMDPDATRIEGIGPPPGPAPGRFLLVVEDEDGTEREVFPLSEALTTVGRRSDDPSLRSSVALDGAPHVSRRQLALVWEPQRGEPGFRVYNLGLNTVHVGDAEVPGANLGKGPLRLEEVADLHAVRLTAGETLRIGEHGPVLRLRENDDAGEDGPPVDPDATRFG